MKLFTALSLAAVLSTPVMADTWVGSGTMYSPDREPMATYDVVVEQSAPVAGQITSNIEVTDESGDVMTLTCDVFMFTKAWRKTCSDGQEGGGYSFDLGMATEYTNLPDGRSFATTLINDSEDAIRILRTELLGDTVLSFAVESYTKQDAAE